MIEQTREMLLPGAGIARDPGPTKQHEEFPRYMVHPGYQKGAPDKEIKELNENGSPTGRLFYRGGESIRFAPVLVRNAQDRDFHISQGYEDRGKSDAAAFARLVADAETVPENYKPIEYPKYCFGKIVNDAVEEEARLIEVNVNKDGTPREASSEAPAAEPSVNAEVNTLDVFPGDPGSEEDEIAALEARLSALKAKAALSPERPFVVDAEAIKDAVAAEAAAAPTMEEFYEKTFLPQKAAKNEARIAKIKATIARKKAEREAAEKAA